jgi:hypothetical protein
MSEVKVDLSKIKPKKVKETVTKLDLSTKKEEVIQELNSKELLNSELKTETTPKEVIITKDEGEQEEERVVIQDITEEEESKPKEDAEPVVKDDKDRVETTLPDGVDKLVKFINETGGNVEDYVRLNADYSNVDDKALLKEYYKKIKPHLDDEEIDFVMGENFYYDEDLDDERDIKLKKLAQKEEVLKARSFLDNLKDKYYEEIKLRPTVSNEQRKATDFFNRYNEGQQQADKASSLFKSNTKNFFKNDFKGFDFNLGEKKFRYGVSNPDLIADNQSSIDNILGKFLDDNGDIKQLNEYHKAMYVAQNADKIASHFYEQGKADGVKDVAIRSKNITADSPRQTSNDSLFINGLKVKAVNGVDSSKLKINKNKF